MTMWRGTGGCLHRRLAGTAFGRRMGWSPPLLIGGRLLWASVAAVASLLWPPNGVLHAQIGNLTVTGEQDLQFGAVLPGLPTPISAADATNAGRFEIRGNRDAEIVVELTLPSALLAQGGTELPLAFGFEDGRCGNRPSIGQSQGFDPNVPLVALLSRSGRLYIWLGGTAQPIPSQAPGDYSAAINITVAYTGN